MSRCLCLWSNGTYISTHFVRYLKLSAQWNDVVDKIRQVPDFEQFLKPTSFSTLSQAAAEGPVIVVNISKYRSDAIIIRQGASLETVTLQDASPKELITISLKLRGVLDEESVAARDAGMSEILRLLWDSVAEPVVDRLQTMEVPAGSRIWWCPTAELCSLPLHAAGRYDGGQTKSKLPDLFISSYTPTLSALIRARRDQKRLDGDLSILAVGVGMAEGWDDENNALEHVAEELDRVVRYSGVAKRMEDTEASRDAVIEGLRHHPWVHLACHGRQDAEKPFQSRVYLHDQPLTLLDIVRARLPNAEFAFLSACETATGDPNTPDEGLHLAAALQFVGFRSVVGTLWTMNDNDGPDAAEAFYGYMFRQKDHPLGFKDAAKGVYHIAKALRLKKVPLHRWVTFVHVGA